MPAPPRLPPLPAPLARGALDSLGDAVVVVGDDGGVLHLNPAAEELFSRSRARAVGLPARALPGGAPLAALAERARLSGETARAELPHPTGSGPPLAAEASPLFPEGGVSAAGAVVLLTPPRAGEHAFDFEALAAGLAHEIKNPLAGLQGAAELLAQEATGKQRDYANVIAREARRVDGLVKELLDLARPAALALAPVNVHALLDDVVLLARRLPGAERVKFVKRFDPSLPPVHGDAEKLTQVVLNLVRNALDAVAAAPSPQIALETGVAALRLRAASGRTRPLGRIAVIDNGPGIPEEMLPKLFTPFSTSKAHGTGLGLAVSRRIVLAHGGLIEVRNRAAGGAESAVFWPLEVA